MLLCTSIISTNSVNIVRIIEIKPPKDGDASTRVISPVTASPVDSMSLLDLISL